MFAEVDSCFCLLWRAAISATIRRRETKQTQCRSRMRNIADEMSHRLHSYILFALLSWSHISSSWTYSFIRRSFFFFFGHHQKMLFTALRATSFLLLLMPRKRVPYKKLNKYICVADSVSFLYTLSGICLLCSEIRRHHPNESVYPCRRNAMTQRFSHQPLLEWKLCSPFTYLNGWCYTCITPCAPCMPFHTKAAYSQY